MRLAGEVLEFLVGREIVLGRLPDECLEGGELAFLAPEHHVGLGRL